MPHAQLFLLAGSLFAFASVASGAFGAHALEGVLTPEKLQVWETASKYEMYHALGLLFVGWLNIETGQTSFVVAGWAFFVGVLLFAGSLHLLALTDVSWLGAITPIGGVAFLIGWACCFYGLWGDSFSL